MVKTKPREICAESGFGRGETKVGGQCEAKASADRSALDGSNHRLGVINNPRRCGVQLFGCISARIGREVGASAEVFAVSAQQDRSTTVVSIERFERIGHPADQFEREEVVGWSPQLDNSNIVAVDIAVDIDGCAYGGILENGVAHVYLWLIWSEWRCGNWSSSDGAERLALVGLRLFRQAENVLANDVALDLVGATCNRLCGC